jgi:hypothetical protein
MIAALRQAAPVIDVIRVGDPGAPPLGTPDPDLLIAAEALGRVFVTWDRRSMPQHLVAHFATGHHTSGVMLLRPGYTLGRYVGEIVNHWTSTKADDWVDRTIFVP